MDFHSVFESKLYHHDLHDLGWKHLFFPALRVIKGGEKELDQRIK